MPSTAAMQPSTSLMCQPRAHVHSQLIREYLEFNQYQHTLSVFLPESGQPQEPLKRSFVAQRTGLPAQASQSGEPRGDRQLPLLYGLLANHSSRQVHEAPASDVQVRSTGASEAQAMGPEAHRGHDAVERGGGNPKPVLSAQPAMLKEALSLPARGPQPVIFTAAPSN
jgi:hypothetical protein